MLFLERQTIGFVKSYKTFTKKIDFRKEARESRGQQIIVLENGRTGERENGRTGERENGRAGERERRCAGEQESGLDCPGRALAAAREGQNRAQEPIS
ncbi:hypothetical protein RTE01_23400 [Raoultella terrigena]|nr:hypothetical protein RTE01_23400 [Raoultella terrigena]